MNFRKISSKSKFHSQNLSQSPKTPLARIDDSAGYLDYHTDFFRKFCIPSQRNPVKSGDSESSIWARSPRRGPTFLGVCSTNPLSAARGLMKMDRKKSSLDGRSQSHVWTPNRNLVIDFLTLNIGPKGTNLTKNPPKVA